MTPARLEQCLSALWWENSVAAIAFDVSPRTVRAWLSGRDPVPEKIAAWLERMARFHDDNPVPEKED